MHAPEPWRCGNPPSGTPNLEGEYIYDANGECVARGYPLDGDEFQAGPEGGQRAARIAACINFCRHLSDDFLQQNMALGNPDCNEISTAGDKAGKLRWRPNAQF